MNIESELLLHIIQALALGLGVAVILWLLRRHAVVRRLRLSVLLAAVMAGLYLILRGSGIRGEDLLVKMVTAAGILLAAYAGLQLLDLLLWERVVGRRRQAAVPRLLVDLFNLAVLIAVALAVLNGVFGVNLNALLVTSTVVSAIIGLSLQDMLGNLVAGLALQVEQPFTVGDWVQVSGQEGQVTQMNWRTLTLRTRDRHHVILPNASAAKEDLINYSRPTPLQRMHTRVGVAYRHPPGLVKQVLAQAAADAEGVIADPPPAAVLEEFGESAIYYDVRFWIDDYAAAPRTRDAVATRIWYGLRRAGMTIPFPIRDVTVRTLPEDHEARIRERLRREVFAELRPLAVFAPLSDGQIGELARSASLHRYTAGEVLVRQGDEADSLYVIRTGQVRVDVRSESGQVAPVATLGRGDFFGEMSLLTGEPRSASVIAETETEVVVVDRAAFGEVISADTGLLEGLTVALEERARSTSEQVALAAHTAPARQIPQRAAVLDRIRRFFGIKPG